MPADERALELARSQSDELTLGMVLMNLGGTLALAGRADESAALIREAQPILERPGRPRLQARMLISRGLVLGAGGRGAEASELFAEAARLARAGGFYGVAFRAQGNLADSLWMGGDLDGALAAARDALAQSQNSAFATQANVGLALANLHGILTERGDLAEAAAVGRDFIDQSRDAGAVWIVLDSFALRYAKAGDYTTAAHLLGWNERAVRTKNVRRQINEQRAYESTLSILRAKLAPRELERLLAEGTKMSEEDVYRRAAEA